MPEEQEELHQFEELFRRNYQRLCRHVQRITNDADVAEDLVQEVFVHFWNNERRHTVGTPEAYIYRATINRALNYASSQKRRSALDFRYQQQQPIAANGTEQGIFLQETQLKLQQAVAALPPVCQQVFLLSRYEEMSHKEIADFLGISPNTVDNHIKKALGVLRKVLLALLLVLFKIYFSFLP